MHYLLFRLMSIVRGFLQGYQKMEPTAVSQLVEQIVRIIAVLVGAYIVVNFMHESPENSDEFRSICSIYWSDCRSCSSLLVLEKI